MEDYSRKVKDDNDKQMNNKRMSGAKMFMQNNMLLMVRLVSDQTCDHDTLLQVKLLGEELMNN